MGEAWVTIHRTSDPIEADILGDLLTQHGIEARVLGTRNAALLGAAQHIMTLRIEVPPHQTKEACEVVDAYMAEHKASAEDAAYTEAAPDGAFEPGEPESETEPEKLDRVKALVGLLIPGGAHFYARKPATGVVILVGYAAALGTLFGHYWQRYTVVAATLSFFGLVLYDLIGGQLGVGAFNRGERTPVSRQVPTALCVAAGIGILSWLVAPYVPWEKRQDPPPVEEEEAQSPYYQ